MKLKMLAKPILAVSLLMATLDFGSGYNLFEGVFTSLFAPNTTNKVDPPNSLENDRGPCDPGYYNCGGVCVPYSC